MTDAAGTNRVTDAAGTNRQAQRVSEVRRGDAPVPASVWTAALELCTRPPLLEGNTLKYPGTLSN